MSETHIYIDEKGYKTIVAKPLTATNFAIFGDVIECNEQVENFTINQGFTRRFHNLADIDVSDNDGKAIISIFRTIPLEQPIRIGMMERHPKGSQAFIPIGNQPYLVVVAPKGELNLSQIQVFIASSDQGVNYHKGTWHHFCLALNEQSDFLVVDRCGEGNNCDEITFIDEQKIIIKF
ncbi:ureidoglycolate lyase [Pseudoalteromonas denitrificans]|uniref:Ureidoglycolate lyase n=1 Tax=Pseudoalteromonas denitrificans DSM 6059 TaxID=1123010 RepID=A0A1I1LE35_9GAMM|nr:ureidoglycolate lyase [Pseudoalteromonas denitrificans]SFC68643.1 ureidoglycolate lyase [Pseudoalteromonas denitrificans DSM 6059]